MANETAHDGFEVPAKAEEEAQASRRGLLALFGALGAATLAACGAEREPAGALGQQASQIVILPPGDFGTDIAWVKSVLGPGFPTRDGDLAQASSGQLGASVVIAEGACVPGDGGGGVFIWATDANASDDGGTVIVPLGGGVGASGAEGCWKRIYEGPLNVKWFGAISDEGSAHDSRNVTAIQAAIAAAWIGAGELYFPAGTYRVNAAIGLPSPTSYSTARAIRLRGATIQHTEMYGGTQFGTVIRQVTSGTHLFVASAAVPTDGTSPVPRYTFEHLVLLGPVTDPSGSSGGDGILVQAAAGGSAVVPIVNMDTVVVAHFDGAGVHLRGCENGTLKDVRVSKCNIGFQLSDSVNAYTFLNCIAELCHSFGAHISAGCETQTWVGGMFQSNDLYGVYLTNNVWLITFMGTHFEGNNRLGRDWTSALVISGTSAAGVRHIQFINVLFEGPNDTISIGSTNDPGQPPGVQDIRFVGGSNRDVIGSSAPGYLIAVGGAAAVSFDEFFDFVTYANRLYDTGTGTWMKWGGTVRHGANLTVRANGNLGVGTPDQFGGGTGVIGIANTSAAPASAPTAAGVLYVQNGALMYMGPSGTPRLIAAG